MILYVILIFFLYRNDVNNNRYEENNLNIKNKNEENGNQNEILNGEQENNVIENVENKNK